MQSDLYTLRWSARILDEAEKNLIESGRYNAESIRRRIKMIRTHFQDAEVVGYEDLINSMKCEAKDRHVLAAAIRGGANQIVTLNLRDFPTETLETYGIEVVSPDTFFLNTLELAPRTTTQIIREQIAALRKPPLSTAAVLMAIAKSGATEFAQRMETILAVIDQDM